ncbi:MAG: hypothetical protein O2944_07865, partial [Proteobacteria bacterium]|nr:hypothetical protein [Pseudomonadota bacterium]
MPDMPLTAAPNDATAARPSPDHYEALFGRIIKDQPAAVPAAAPVSFWQRLADDERYEKLNLAATYVAVFFAPLAAFIEILIGQPPDALKWSAEWSRWIELGMGTFFAFDTLVG